MRGYEELAAAIVARNVEDLVDILIFIRDLNNETNRELIHRFADKAFRDWQRLLKKNKPRKEVHRRRKRDCITKIQQKKDGILYQEKVIRTLQLNISQAECELMRARRCRGMKVMPAKNSLSRFKEQLRKEEAYLVRLKKDLTNEYANLEYEKDLIRDLKAEENYLRTLCSPKVQHKLILQSARLEMRNVEAWFYSEQFNKLSELNPTALIERSKRAVRAGITHADNKYIPYFLKGQVDETIY